MPTRKIGRDAKTGKFIPIKAAQKDKSHAVVEIIKIKKKKIINFKTLI